MTFKELNIVEPILRALEEEGYTAPTPIQHQAIPIIIEGNDVLGCAQTGTGKTAAFSIPIIQRYGATADRGRARTTKALVLTPTRELAIQIGESFATYGKYTSLKHTVIFGGVKQKSQTDALRMGVDVLVATPGRLLDLIGQGYVNLKSIEFFVLDEADRMLDMGFIHDIKRILPLLPKNRQTLFFSATMPKEIASLASTMLDKPVSVEVTPVSSTVDMIEQSLYHVEKKDKSALLIELLENKDMESVLVFSRTKHGADKIAKTLSKAGIEAQAIHGNKSQNARQRALSMFKEHSIRVLIATDIAARGIDVDNLSHVINYDLPDVPETYVHRIGRTGRAGKSGIAIAFCDIEEATLLRDIQKLIGKQLQLVRGGQYDACNVSPSYSNSEPSEHRRSQPSRGGRGGGGSSRSSSARGGGGGRGRSSSSGGRFSSKRD